MTVNGMIAAMLLVGGLTSGYAALRMFWEIRGRWKEWPVSALVALGGVILAGAVVACHTAWIRLWGAPFGWSGLGPNGYGTAARTLVYLWVSVAMAQRLARHGILNPGDRAAIRRQSTKDGP